MSALIQMEMTLDEAVETDRLIKRHINHTRYLLLDMRDRKGWKALGYESFVEYGKKSLGYDKSHIYELADAGEIGLQVGFSEISEKQPKESHLKPLKAVPEEERKAIWEEATRKAEEENAKLTAQRVESAVKEWKQRQQESQTESNERRNKIRELEAQIDLLGKQAKPEPVTVEVPPADYESIKDKAEKAEKAEKALEKLKKEQDDLVAAQVKAKLQGYQSEVDAMERKKAVIQDQVDRMKTYMESLDSEAKRLEVHHDVIEKSRLELISLAAFLNDLDPITDKGTIKKWLALADMHQAAADSIGLAFGHHRFELSVAA